MVEQRPILTVTVNPALDLSTHLGRLAPQIKLRCGPPRLDAGGGGVNVSRVVRELGGDSTAFVALGGATGAQLKAMLAAQGLRIAAFEVPGETRTSFTVMEDETARHYRFVLPGPPQHPALAEAMRTAIVGMIPAEAIVVLSGSLLPGLPTGFYADLSIAARERGATVMLDSHGQELREALAGRPGILRLNHIEAAELLGAALHGDAAASCRLLLERDVADMVLVAQGSDGTAIGTRQEIHWVHPPKVEVNSSVGAGDSFVGAFVLALARGADSLEACRLGTAAAASAVLAEGTGLCQRGATEAMYAATKVEAVPGLAPDGEGG
jgi:6-phosphofructokinase 2